MKIIDPRKISKSELPLVVLVDDRRSLLGWFIKSHTSGQYNHVQELYNTNYYASQTFWGYKDVLIEKYVKPNITLKFWGIKMTPEQQEKWIEIIEADLRAPWVKRRYDWVGILGQILAKINPKFRHVNSPWAKFCTERIADRIRNISGIPFPYHLNPGSMNEEFKKDSRFTYLGHHFVD